MPDPFFDVPARLVAEPTPGDNAAAMSVGELSNKLKRFVEGEFGHVRLRGEISGYKRVASGHAYLALKDDGAVIDGVIWKGSFGGIALLYSLRRTATVRAKVRERIYAYHHQENPRNS